MALIATRWWTAAPRRCRFGVVGSPLKPGNAENGPQLMGGLPSGFGMRLWQFGNPIGGAMSVMWDHSSKDSHCGATELWSHIGGAMPVMWGPLCPCGTTALGGGEVTPG